MGEQIDTIPVNEAFETEDECPFCYLERQAEQKAMRYILGPGASYMEPDVRGVTDRQGFCRRHYKKMFDYGNSLGNALLLQTYYVGMLRELEERMPGAPEKKKRFGKKQEDTLPVLQWLRQKNGSCFLCDKVAYNMNRYYMTFFHLIRDADFRKKTEAGKGFCLYHFQQLLEAAPDKLQKEQQAWFYDTVFKLVQKNLARVQEDLDWFVAKFDYRNADAPWKNSQDAVSRSMQKLKGIYPADPPYRQD